MLITGATGFIGAAFLKRALTMGWHVRVLTRKSNNWPSQHGIEIVVGDLASTQDWSPVVAGVHVIVHAAAEIKDPALMQKVNVLGPTQLLHAAVNAGVKRWVQLSSVGAYGVVQEGVVREDWSDHPSGQYEVSKSKFDELLKRTTSNEGINICILRPSNVYGPGMRNQSITQMTNAIRKGVFAFIGSPGASANYVHVDDVVQALELCIEHPQAAHQIYIVSAWATMEDMVSGLSAGAGIATPKRRMWLLLAMCLAGLFKWLPRWPLTLSRVKAMSMRSSYSTEKIEHELGWRLSVPVKEGMQQFAKNMQP
jgi:nucleoside-diphosphate-sugar epimerase